MGTKRTRLQIIRDILTVIRSKSNTSRSKTAPPGAKPTHILYKSNLSHAMMDSYLKELLAKEFITEHALSKGRCYSITEKGTRYLEKYAVIEDFSRSFGLNEIGE